MNDFNSHIEWISELGQERRGGARDAFAALQMSEQLRVLRLLIDECMVFVGQKTVGFKSTKRWIERWLQLTSSHQHRHRHQHQHQYRHQHRRRVEDGQERRDRLVYLHRIAHELLPVGFDCITTTTTLWWLLKARGYKPSVHIGVRSFGGVFEAHAWLSENGDILNDRRGEYHDYRELPLSSTNL